ncbi:hypothetical protein QYS49_37595 [Marivirga salinae]|uniref:DUF4304 domain-containing protein n=1 Tax=Marivirga salinarum TaxID=3059078 RepID=A0AA51N9A2_9BACT|nr:hypothetical protein [Marivirga sp. BDSF4-3]WMN11211.1 hypothetical protein QYS49_37595 [Marivirga sp. BDSF4-3]
MKTKVIQNLEDFLNDFQYFKIEGFDAFHHPFESGSKMVVLNITPYEDGFMLEVKLAIKVDKVEEYIFRFYNQESGKLSLSYWESLSQISSQISKRGFIHNEIELSKILAEIENALVKTGFNWLDELCELSRLSNHLINVIYNSIQKPPNLFKLCQRSYLLRFLEGEKITEAVFYDYFEQMQLHKIPEHQLEEFLEFRNYLKSLSI